MNLRKSLVALLIVAMLLLCTAHADAWVASRSKWVIGDVVFSNEVTLWKPTQTMFHQQTLATSDTEAMAISFPAATRVFDNAIVEETGVAIAQTSDEAILSTDTGFFKANWCFNGFTNNGGLIIGDVGGVTPVLAGPMIGSGLIWPYMTAPIAPAAAVGNTVMSFKPYMNSSEVAGNVTMTPSSGVNNTAANTSSPKVVGTNNTAAWKSKTPLNYKTATKDQIKNASSMEKLWRNANVKSTMPQAYNGTVDRPNWIDPKSSVLKMSNRSKAVSDAINMTDAGEDLHTLLWDL
jgi:hypothetical protein